MDLVVIPARWGSSRFPGKPLALIAGRSLIARVVDLARRSIHDRTGVELVVATDNAAIAGAVEALGCTVAMTDTTIGSGSGRALAAAYARNSTPRYVVNLQGDAPFVPASAIGAVLDALAETGVGCATPVIQLDWDGLDRLRAHKRGTPFSGTTCIRGNDGRAIWFSKAILPAIRDEATLRGREALSPIYRHLGLYGYTLAALEAFEAAAPSSYERLEGLEQLRLIELNIPIQTVVLRAGQIAMSGIDTPADVALAEALIAAHGDPFGK